MKALSRGRWQYSAHWSVYLLIFLVFIEYVYVCKSVCRVEYRRTCTTREDDCGDVLHVRTSRSGKTRVHLKSAPATFQLTDCIENIY